jgi:hypothetical protein
MSLKIKEENNSEIKPMHTILFSGVPLIIEKWFQCNCIICIKIVNSKHTNTFVKCLSMSLKFIEKNLCIYFIHLCTSKTPTKSADLSDKGNSYHALETCEGVKKQFRKVVYTGEDLKPHPKGVLCFKSLPIPLY